MPLSEKTNPGEEQEQGRAGRAMGAGSQTPECEPPLGRVGGNVS